MSTMSATTALPAKTKDTRKLKEPGSAITHFIGMVLALTGAIPLLIRGAGNPNPFHEISLAVFIISMVLLYGASATSPQNGSYDDLCPDRGHLHPDLCNRIKRCDRIWHAGSRMGHSSGWHDNQSLLDHLSEMVLFRHLYRHGLDLCSGIYPDHQHADCRRFWLASGRRDHLYGWRNHLCLKAAAF